MSMLPVSPEILTDAFQTNSSIFTKEVVADLPPLEEADAIDVNELVLILQNTFGIVPTETPSPFPTPEVTTATPTATATPGIPATAEPSQARGHEKDEPRHPSKAFLPLVLANSQEEGSAPDMPNVNETRKKLERIAPVVFAILVFLVGRGIYKDFRQKK